MACNALSSGLLLTFAAVEQDTRCVHTRVQRPWSGRGLGGDLWGRCGGAWAERLQPRGEGSGAVQRVERGADCRWLCHRLVSSSFTIWVFQGVHASSFVLERMTAGTDCVAFSPPACLPLLLPHVLLPLLLFPLKPLSSLLPRLLISRHRHSPIFRTQKPRAPIPAVPSSVTPVSPAGSISVPL